jgi:hypothetical protein
MFQRGLIPRAKETLVTLILLSGVVLGITFVLSAILDRDQGAITQLYSKYYLYSKRFPLYLLGILGHSCNQCCASGSGIRDGKKSGSRTNIPTFFRELRNSFHG